MSTIGVDTGAPSPTSFICATTAASKSSRPSSMPMGSLVTSI